MQTIYTGDRVRIRPFRSGEEAYLTSCRVHQQLNPFWGEMWCPRASDIRGYNNDGFLTANGDNIFAIDRLDTGELIGFEVGLQKVAWPLIGEVGTFIEESHRKQGFGVEAKQLSMHFLFDNFQLNQVWGITLENHAPARRGLELSGMTYVGSKRMSYLSQGRFRDIVFYRMWRRDWEQHQIHKVVRRGIAD